MKNLSKTILTVIAVGLLSCGLFCQQAQATPITGDIQFTGIVTFDNTDLSMAKQVSTWDLCLVLSDSGSFSSIPALPTVTNVTMTAPWIFNPSTATIPLWQVGGFTFDLASSTIVTQTTTFLNVTGVGTLSAAGFDTTPGTWSFTISNTDGLAHSTFGFQADTAPKVPDGGATAALLGVALAGVEVLRRKLKAA